MPTAEKTPSPERAHGPQTDPNRARVIPGQNGVIQGELERQMNQNTREVCRRMLPVKLGRQ
jgi:hypothetical protein